MVIKDYVVNCTVKFSFYRDGMLWYNVIGGPAEFIFPVPITDIGNATFNCEDKAVLFMRYIRKHKDVIDAAVSDAAIAEVTVDVVECPVCKDSGMQRVSESPSGQFMIPCEDCDAGKV